LDRKTLRAILGELLTLVDIEINWAHHRGVTIASLACVGQNREGSR